MSPLGSSGRRFARSPSSSMGGDDEEQQHFRKGKGRWTLVTWSSFVEALSTGDTWTKKDLHKRPTSLWTIAGMAAISALFIYLIQSSVSRPSSPPPSQKLDMIFDSKDPSRQTVVDVPAGGLVNSKSGGGEEASPDPAPENGEVSAGDGKNDSSASTADETATANGSSVQETSDASAEPSENKDSNAQAGASNEAHTAEGGDSSREAPEGADNKPAGGEESNSSDPPADQEKSSQEPAQGQAQGSGGNNGSGKVAHVFISTDETDLRPIFVVINSTLSNAKHPESVDFNLIMPQINEAAAREKLLPLFPGVKIDINRGSIDNERIENLITYKEGSGARRELVSVFNFIPFYLPFISRDLDRIVYLDADIVVVGDVAELAEVDMEGKPAAAVEDCMQMFKTYFDFKQLAEIQASKDDTKPWMPHFQYDKKACVFNRGVLLIDVQQWIKDNMTETIEWWMKKYQQSKKPLYKFGLSQPPFLLALYERYKKLDRCWNTRGLGRDGFGDKERDFLARIGFGRPPKKPFLSPWADTAKIMHFNGKFKPWRMPRLRAKGEKPQALCGESMMDCAQIWWRYMNEETQRKLTPANEEASKVQPAS